jgi:hypothetical protein
MHPARSTASHASVAYLRIPDFAQHGVAEEAQLKEQLERVIAAALPAMNAQEWIVIDASEGLAVVILANPRGALKFAWRALGDPEIRPAIGIAHGPVRVAQGTPPVLYGDALLAAEGTARATARGEVLITRDYRDALTRSRPMMRRLLPRAGTAIDDQGRAFEIFRADHAVCMKRQKAFLTMAALIAAGIVTAAIAIRANRSPPPPPPVVVVPPPPVVQPPPEPAPGAVVFEIRPSGEVYVDGALKGKTPPLKKIQVPPGSHQIEVRSGKFKPLVVELAVGPGEEFAVEHNFVARTPPKAPVKTPAKAPPAKPKPAPAAPPKAPAEEKSFWDRFVDWFKG